MYHHLRQRKKHSLLKPKPRRDPEKSQRLDLFTSTSTGGPTHPVSRPESRGCHPASWWQSLAPSPRQRWYSDSTISKLFLDTPQRHADSEFVYHQLGRILRRIRVCRRLFETSSSSLNGIASRLTVGIVGGRSVHWFLLLGRHSDNYLKFRDVVVWEDGMNSCGGRKGFWISMTTGVGRLSVSDVRPLFTQRPIRHEALI